ncbi:MAG TPA: VWA domain-containing protein [Acidobacteriota bacterium]
MKSQFSRFSIFFLTLLLAILPFWLLGSEPSSTQGPTNETVNVDLVDLYISAVDKKGHFISDLRADELSVQENGIPQQISHFSDSSGQDPNMPLSLSFVMDSSASMDEDIDDIKKLDMARDAGLLLLSALGPYDKMQLITFNETPTPSEFTGDHNKLAEQLNSVRIHFRHTALFDAIDFAIDQLDKEYGRKILMVCSDGQDNLSKKKINNILDKAQNISDLTVVVFGTITYSYGMNWYGAVRKANDGKDNLQNLATKTGGYAFFPENRKQIGQVQELIKGFVRSQYSLAYRSTNPNADGTWRQINIACKRKGVQLHYRNGYYAR